VDPNDAERSILSFLRYGHDPSAVMLVVGNFTPVLRPNVRVGVPRDGIWREVMNSDATDYGGQGFGNLGQVEANPVAYQGQPYALNLNLPPLSILFLMPA
jgi:1,4-alpha-glucan branching enzyme